MTALALPDLRLYDAWAVAVRDFGGPAAKADMAGSGWWWLPAHLQGSDSREACAAMVDRAARSADVTAALEPGQVHSDSYWVTDAAAPSGADVVGFLSVRHALNDFLNETGGHIGYSVRPSRRRRGHASRALGLALGRAAGLGIERALVTCDDSNEASRRTIEGAGGVLEDVRAGKLRYWIVTDALEGAPRLLT